MKKYFFHVYLKCKLNSKIVCKASKKIWWYTSFYFVVNIGEGFGKVSSWVTEVTTTGFKVKGYYEQASTVTELGSWFAIGKVK